MLFDHLVYEELAVAFEGCEPAGLEGEQLGFAVGIQVATGRPTLVAAVLLRGGIGGLLGGDLSKVGAALDLSEDSVGLSLVLEQYFAIVNRFCRCRDFGRKLLLRFALENSGPGALAVLGLGNVRLGELFLEAGVETGVVWPAEALAFERSLP